VNGIEARKRKKIKGKELELPMLAESEKIIFRPVFAIRPGKVCVTNNEQRF